MLLERYGDSAGQGRFSRYLRGQHPVGLPGVAAANDFAQFEGDPEAKAAPCSFWGDVDHLAAAAGSPLPVMTTRRIVRASIGNPLGIFYTVEKLVEARRGPEQTGALCLARTEAITHVEPIALSRGGAFMTELGEQLTRLAERRQNRLFGERSRRAACCSVADLPES
ncbi:MAG: hypothetical protein R2851_16875 [Caldilineaceae bacterium]